MPRLGPHEEVDRCAGGEEAPAQHAQQQKDCRSRCPVHGRQQRSQQLPPPDGHLEEALQQVSEQKEKGQEGGVMFQGSRVW